MNQRIRRLFVTAACSATLLALGAGATADVIDATADLWIRQSGPTTSYENDWISVWSNPSDVRHGVIEFDLSSTVGTTINSAFLQLFDPDDERSMLSPFVQQAYVLTTAPPDIVDYTWDEYVTFDQAVESPLAALGSYSIAAGDSQDGYDPSALATASDISLLESVRDNNGGRVVMIIKAASGERDWLDIERGTPPRLVINQPVPPYGDLNGDGVFDANDLEVITDPANWLQEVPPGIRGDILPDGVVDLQDFHIFKQTLVASQASPSALIPEPSAGIMASAAVAAASLLRRGRTCVA